jgi:hypothetical protein
VMAPSPIGQNEHKSLPNPVRVALVSSQAYQWFHRTPHHSHSHKTQQKTPKPAGFGAWRLYKDIPRTSPARAILLLIAALLRGVTARVVRGGVLHELGKCVDHFN